jgi:DNA modification methylase
MTAVVLRADARRLPLDDASVDLIVTSPPYYALRSYTDGGEHYDGQIGSEPTPAEYIDSLIACTREWVRVLKPTGSLWVNLGDKYGRGTRTTNVAHTGTRANGRTGYSAATRTGYDKSLIGLPWRYALRCIDDLGLILRAEVIWSKPNGLPESVTDRVRRSHEHWFHLVKQPRYYSAIDHIRQPAAASTHQRWKGDLRRRDNGYRRDPVTDRQTANVGGAGEGTLGVNSLGALPCSVWEIPAEPLQVPAHLGIDHYAAFPLAWPRRIIQGWSPRGVCDDCGFLLGSTYDNGMLGVRGSHNRRTRKDRARTQAGTQAQPLLREDLLKSMECQEPEDHQVPPSDDTGLRGGLETGSSDGAEERLHDGASAHHGAAPRPLIGAERDRPPQERDQDRQPDREPRTTWQGRARPTAQAAAQAVRVPSLRRDAPDLRNAQPCPNCGGTSFGSSVVADFFGGTGTTALVAHALGRHGISVDMSADYCRLARWRTTDPDQLAKAMQVDKPPKQVADQFVLDLFSEESAVTDLPVGASDV